MSGNVIIVEDEDFPGVIATPSGVEYEFIVVDEGEDAVLVIGGQDRDDTVVTGEAATSVVVTPADPPDVIVTDDDEDQSFIVHTDHQGPAGLSAYELWLLNGNQGSEQDFLDSLVGPAGPSGQSYRHVQSVPSDVWVIEHGLGFEPAGLVVQDSAGTTVEGSIDYVDANTVRVTFTAAFSGTAYVS